MVFLKNVFFETSGDTKNLIYWHEQTINIINLLKGAQSSFDGTF